MTDQIRAPWTPEQVAALNAFQLHGGMHPFTCGADHPGPSPALVARPDGWHCPGTYRAPCDYRQDWAHRFMADPHAWPKPFADLRQAAAEATESETKCGPACTEQHTYRLDGCALCCVEMHGSVAQPAWAVPCPDRRCQAPADRPCVRSGGSPAGVCHEARFAALDRARDAAPPQDGPHAPQDAPQRPDADAETPDGTGGAQAGAEGREVLREKYAAAVECAIGLNVDCGGTEGVHRVRDAILAVCDRELERLEKLHQAHLRVEQRLAGEGLVAAAAVERIRLHIAAHRQRLRLADPVLLAKVDKVLREVGELEAAGGGEESRYDGARTAP